MATTSLAAHLRVVITRTARRLRQEAGGDLSPSQTAALGTIERRGPLTPSELAAIERIQRPTATRVIARLEESGLIARAADPVDRRSSLVWLTEQGRQLRDWLAETLRWHASMLPQAMILEFDLESTALTLRRIERLWTRASDLVERSARFAA